GVCTVWYIDAPRGGLDDPAVDRGRRDPAEQRRDRALRARLQPRRDRPHARQRPLGGERVERGRHRPLQARRPVAVADRLARAVEDHEDLDRPPPSATRGAVGSRPIRFDQPLVWAGARHSIPCWARMPWSIGCLTFLTSLTRSAISISS